MDLYMMVVADDMDEVKEPVSEAIRLALEEETIRASLVDECESESPSDWRLGIELSLSKKKFLQQPLNFLQTLAKQHKIDFVVGFVENGEAEDVCYFGFNEGKPDLFEVGTYLGLK